MENLMVARCQPVFVQIGTERVFDGTVISSHPIPHIVGVMEDVREAQLAALAPSMLRALDGLLRHQGTFFPHGLTKDEKDALHRAKRVYSRARTICIPASETASVAEGAQ